MHRGRDVARNVSNSNGMLTRRGGGRPLSQMQSSSYHKARVWVEMQRSFVALTAQVRLALPQDESRWSHGQLVLLPGRRDRLGFGGELQYQLFQQQALAGGIGAQG